MGTDELVQSKLVAFNQKLITAFREKHPQIFSMLEYVMTGHHNVLGLQVSEARQITGLYTFVMEGIEIIEVKRGCLEGQFRHPLLGMIKPYMTVERRALEEMIKDEGVVEDPFAAFAKYLPDITFGFLP